MAHDLLRNAKKSKNDEFYTQIDILKGELERKNDQLDKMQSLLDQQQRLNLSTNRQNEKLLDTTTNNTPSQDDRPLQNDDTDVLKPTEGKGKRN